MKSMLEIYDIVKDQGCKKNIKKYAITNFVRPKSVVVTKLNRMMYHHTRSRKNSTNFESLNSIARSDDLHKITILKFDVPCLKSLELVSSISSKVDDEVQNMEFHKESHINQASITLEYAKEIYLKKGEENSKFIDLKDQFHIGLTRCSEFRKKINPPRYLKRNENYKSTLKPRSSLLHKTMEFLTPNVLKNNDKFGFNEYKKDELNAICTYKSRGVKGVKEDCERFRLQMKILKKKANDSRIREVMVEGLVENMHRNKNHEETTKTMITHNDSETKENNLPKSEIGSISKTFLNSTSDMSIDRNMIKIGDDIETNKENERELFASLTIKESPNSMASYSSTFEGQNIHQNNAHEDFKARKKIKTYNNVIAYSSTSSSSKSSSLSTLSSLPLSHYIQKLKCLAPISRCHPNTFTDMNKYISKNEHNTSLNTQSFFDIGKTDCEMELENSKNQNQNLQANCEKTTDFIENNCNMQVHGNPTSHLDKKSSDINANTLIPIQPPHFEPQLEIYACHKAKKSIIASLKKNNRINNGDRINKKVGNIMIEDRIFVDRNQHLNKECLPSFNSSKGLILQQSNFHSNEENKYIRCENDSSQQMIFNDLKGLIEGFNIQIDAKNKILKTRFDKLEKQWGYSKEKMLKEILDARRILQNDINARLEEVLNNFMKKNEDSDEHILSMMDKKIERHQLQGDIGILALKSEMKHLWNEVKELSEKKESIQSYINNFINSLEKSKFEVNYEKNLLKNENIALMKQLQNMKESEMQIEIENIRKLVEKLQENNVELEKTQSISQMEGIQERMLIMERVDSLSKLYLGGLEEIRSNVSNIKINCRDRVDELEGQLAQFRCSQQCNQTHGHSNLTHHMLMKELESIRTEVAKIVEGERDHVREMLERENINIQRQLMTICATNKHEILNSMRGELNERLQCAQTKVLLMMDALKQEMDNLRCEVGESKDRAQGLSKATSIIGKEVEIASSAAAEATICATKAKDMLDEIYKSFANEITNVKHTSFQLQEHLKFEKNMVQSIANEAFKTSEELAREKEQMLLVASAVQAKIFELNELIHKESLSIIEIVAIVKNERDAASEAAQEARCSAIKANEVMSEISKYFNGHMIKVQNMSMQLKEKIEHEKREIQKSCEIALQQNQKSLDKYDKELESTIKTWKHGMNVEIAKAMEITKGLEEEQQQASIALEHVAMLCSQPHRIRMDMEKYISRTQDALDNLAQSIQKLQVEHKDYHQISFVKQQELKQFKDSWQTEMSQLQQVIQVLEKRFKEPSQQQSIVSKRLETIETMQVHLVQSYEDIRNIIGDLEKTAAIWLPKYEVAAKIVNELSSKVQCVDEQLQLNCGGESLMQRIAQITDSKVNGMKDMVMESYLNNVDIEVKGLLKRIDIGDSANCHAIATLENRISVLENLPTHDANMSLKSKYIENCDQDNCRKGNKSLNGNLNQSIETPPREMKNIEVNKVSSSNLNQEFSSKVLRLESRIEHVALATFTNLRLLDKKIEHVNEGMQTALNGATMADKKCAALGFELVKVFRMFSCKHGSHCQKNDGHLKKPCKVLKIPTSSFKKDELDSKKQDFDSPNQVANEKFIKSQHKHSKIFDNLQPTSSIVKLDNSPRKVIKQSLHNLTKDPITQSCESQKSTSQYELEQDSEELHGFDDSKEKFLKDKSNCFQNSLKSKECKLHGPLTKVGELNTPCGTSLDGQSMLEKCQEGFVNNCQRTNIRLEAGRIHVNVSHRSRGLNQLHKKNDLIAVQS